MTFSLSLHQVNSTHGRIALVGDELSEEESVGRCFGDQRCVHQSVE